MTDLLPRSSPSTPTTVFDGFAERGDHPAVVTAAETLSYEELDHLVGDVAESLGPDRRLVAVEAANTVPALVAYLGALRAGHPVLLLPPDAGIDHPITVRYRPDVVLDGSNGWEPTGRRSTAGHELHPDLSLLLSTSGSTGSPKLVRLSHTNVASNAAAIASYLSLRPSDRAMTTLPMQYCYGLSIINSHLHAGATIVLNQLSVVDRCFWDLFHTSQATSLAGVPHTFDLLDRAGFEEMDLPTLRYITQAGGRLPAATVRRLADLGAERGWDLYVMYGQTEATARMAYLPPALASAHPTTIGVPVPGGHLWIEDADQHGVGQLVYRGPNVMMGYAEEPADLARGHEVDALRTGDLARRTPDGLFEVVGRLSRFVKPFGLRIDLDRLERMCELDGTEVTFTGDDHGVVAAVGPGVDLDAATRLVGLHSGLPHSCIAVVAPPELPRLSNGKVDHAALRQLAESPREVGPAPDAARTGLEAVKQVFRDVLSRDPSEDDTFVGLGGDSLSYVELSIRLESVVGALPRHWHLSTVGELARLRRRPRAFAPTDTSAVIRAVSIVLIVATHVHLWQLPGGAHTLLAVAGFNFARFQRGARSAASAIARIAAPSVVWIALVAAFSDQYGWPNVLLVHSFVERPSDEWGYWFVESLVHMLAVVTALLAVPALARLERSRPFALPVALLTAGLLVRFDVVGAATSYETSRPLDVFWLFALGWAAARAPAWPQRLLVSAIAAVAIPGYFDDPSRDGIILVGCLALIWLPTVPLPRPAQRLVAPLAASSLFVYLTHYQVFPVIERWLGPEAAVAGSLLVGGAAWLVWRRLEAVGVSRFHRHRSRHARQGQLRALLREPRQAPLDISLSRAPMRAIRMRRSA